jgi:hypothetical protein
MTRSQRRQTQHVAALRHLAARSGGITIVLPSHAQHSLLPSGVLQRVSESRPVRRRLGEEGRPPS